MAGNFNIAFGWNECHVQPELQRPAGMPCCEYCRRPVGYRTSCEGCGAGVTPIAERASPDISPAIAVAGCVGAGLMSKKRAKEMLGLPSFFAHDQF